MSRSVHEAKTKTKNWLLTLDYQLLCQMEKNKCNIIKTIMYL